MVWLLGCNLLQFHQSPWTSPTFKERNYPSDESRLSSDNPESREEFSVEESKFPSRKAVHQAGSVNKNMSVICFLFFSVTPEASEEHSLETTWNLMLATQSSLRLRPTLDLDPWDLVFLLITKFKFKRPQCRKSKCKWSMQTKRGFWIHVECFCFLKVSRLDSQKHSLNKPVSFILKPCLLLLAKPYLPHKELEKLIHAFITPHWTIVTLFTWASS